MRRILPMLAALSIHVLGCGQGRTDRYCKQASEERSKADTARVFPAERFLEACRKLSPADAQCTVPSFAGSPTVRGSKECRSAYLNPAFPKDILLGVDPPAAPR